MIRESGDGRAVQGARAIQFGKMHSDQSGSAIGHRFAAVYIFLGPFAVARRPGP
jgi:hypothetical protein